jgi:hypothetical protein
MLAMDLSSGRVRAMHTNALRHPRSPGLGLPNSPLQEALATAKQNNVRSSQFVQPR